jgi:hypothetical protein
MPKKLPPIPDKSQLKFRKTLSMPGLLKNVRNEFEKIEEHRSGKVTFKLADVLMSGLAMFGLKYPSLLQFDKATHNDEIVKTNLKKLHGVKQVPSDTQMREILDPVNPEDLRPAYKTIHRQLQRQKILESYKYLDGYIIISIDGTGQFSSTKISCDDCCSRNLRNGEKQYYHQLLGSAIIHPDKSNVFPLFPEAIVQQDGVSKNDCELNASKRLLPAIRKDFPKQKILIVEDSLAANGPHIRMNEELSFSYIIVAKPSNNAYLFYKVKDCCENATLQQFETVDEGGTKRIYNYINNIALNASNPDLLVNFLEYWEFKDGKPVYHNSWITDVELEKDNVYFVMRGGRARWKIENETFNTLKNQGYNLEHNYGHGKQHLSTVLALLMMLQFFIDQVPEFACPLFNAARNRFHSKIQFWSYFRSRFLEHLIPNWEALFLSIIYGLKPQVIQFDTS